MFLTFKADAVRYWCYHKMCCLLVFRLLTHTMFESMIYSPVCQCFNVKWSFAGDLNWTCCWVDIINFCVSIFAYQNSQLLSVYLLLMINLFSTTYLKEYLICVSYSLIWLVWHIFSLPPVIFEQEQLKIHNEGWQKQVKENSYRSCEYAYFFVLSWGFTRQVAKVIYNLAKGVMDWVGCISEMLTDFHVLCEPTACWL